MLPCGHHESNMVETVESKTKFCRQCDIESRCRDAETREKELFEENRSLRATVSTLTAELIRLAAPSVPADVREAAEEIVGYDRNNVGLTLAGWKSKAIELARHILSGSVGGKDEGIDRIFRADDLLSELDQIAESHHEGEYRLPIHDDAARGKMLAAVNAALGITTRPEGK